jgi:hypothetical protein
MTQIAEFTEKRLGQYKHFRLHADRIYITQANTFGTRYEISYMLKNIDPERDKFWIFDPHYSSLLTLVFIASMVAALVIMKIGDPTTSRTVAALIVLAAPVTVGMIRNRRVEFSSFVSTSGNRMFEIGKVGRYKEQYDTFVEMIVAQVKEIQRSPNQAL